DPAEPPGLAAGDDAPRRPVAKVDGARDGDSRARELLRDAESRLVDRDDDRVAARPDSPVVDQAPDRGRQHHSDEVVPGEDERLLAGPGRDDAPSRTARVEDVPRVDRNEPALLDADRPRGGKHFVPLVGLEAAALDKEDFFPGRGSLGPRPAPRPA